MKILNIENQVQIAFKINFKLNPISLLYLSRVQYSGVLREKKFIELNVVHPEKIFSQRLGAD